VVLPKSADPSRPRPAAGASAPRVQEGSPAGAHPGLAFAIALGGCLATYAVLFPFRSGFLGDVVFSGGWVSALELLLFWWGLGVLALKHGKSKRQRDALLLDVLPQELGTDIRPDAVDTFLEHLGKLPARLHDSLMVSRIRKGLELFAARRAAADVVTLLATQSAVDANRVAGSYTLVKVFLWAIPILGFIGTVLGLSLAMASFGGADLTDAEALKASVANITGGLATAFNTTLLGLLLSMLLMFPMSALQRREEDCLTDIDAFCNEALLPRLRSEGLRPEAAGEDPVGWMHQLATQAAEQHRAFLERLEGLTHALSDLVEHVETEVGERTARAVERSTAAAEQHLSALATGVNALNETLAALHGREVKITVERKRRGLFG
jgi:flagellar motor component MotA